MSGRQNETGRKNTGKLEIGINSPQRNSIGKQNPISLFDFLENWNEGKKCDTADDEKKLFKYKYLIQCNAWNQSTEN